MITDTFDLETEEIRTISKREDAIKVDACILTFSYEIMKYILEVMDCELIGNLYSSNGANPIYGFTYEDRYFATYMTPVGAPSSAAFACRKIQGLPNAPLPIMAKSAPV